MGYKTAAKTYPIERLAYTALYGKTQNDKRRAKREMKRKYGYAAGQKAMLEVRQGMMLMSDQQPEAKSLSGNIKGRKADLIIIDEASECTPEMFDAIVETYAGSSTSQQNPHVGQLFARPFYGAGS